MVWYLVMCIMIEDTMCAFGNKSAHLHSYIRPSRLKICVIQDLIIICSDVLVYVCITYTTVAPKGMWMQVVLKSINAIALDKYQRNYQYQLKYIQYSEPFSK